MLDDADFPSASMFAAFSMVTHAGQGCALTSRLLVPNSHHDEIVELIAQNFAKVRHGDPADPKTLMGPLINESQRDKVDGMVQRAVAAGATLVTGGKRLDPGYFYAPTLLTDVDPDSEIAQQEVFGPVLVVIGFDDDDDAVRIANENDYGLGVGVTAGSEERALSVARRVRAGTVSINGGIWYGPDAPFGGYKASGVGRQNGREGFEQYLETKTYAGSLPPEA
jgi:acyl-CoA reductase-like NAD-dependent aldehyde dehydrogenase